ncbi:MAG: acyl-protein synthetase [Polyangiaceae bacterium]|jgi:hypothetical protein
MTDLDTSARLHARVLACMEAFGRGAPAPETFDELACDIARYQARNVGGYARLWEVRKIDPSAVELARQVPAVPTEAFKLARVFAFAENEARAIFRTSGTTIGARGTHWMRDARTYAMASRTFGGRMLMADLELPTDIVVLGPSDAEAPDSSLAFMFGEFVRAWARPAAPEQTFFVRQGVLDIGGLRARLSAIRGTRPVTILATSFALVHLLDALGSDSLPLAPQSRVMQTGGTKGKSRSVPADVLRRAVAHAFAIDPRAVVTEYGMTELSSQFWEATLADPRALPGVYVEPPWARVVAVDPETLQPVAPGNPGVARIEDLANVDSAFAVLAQDRVRRVDGGFELLGRLPGAPPRGCSIALDELVAAQQDEP